MYKRQPYLSAVATPEKLGRGRTGKIKITLDTDKLPKLGLTTASAVSYTHLSGHTSTVSAISFAILRSFKKCCPRNFFGFTNPIPLFFYR